MKLPSIAHSILRRIRPIPINTELHTLADAVRLQDGKCDIKTGKLEKFTTIFNRMSMPPRHVHSVCNGASEKNSTVMSEHHIDLVFVRQELRAARIVFEEVTLGPKAIMKIDAALSGLERRTDEAEAYWQEMYRNNCDAALPVEDQTGTAKLAASILGSYLNILAPAEPELSTALPFDGDGGNLAHSNEPIDLVDKAVNAVVQISKDPAPPRSSKLSIAFSAHARKTYVPLSFRSELMRTFAEVSGVPDLATLKRGHYEVTDFVSLPNRNLTSMQLELDQITERLCMLNEPDTRATLLAIAGNCSGQVAAAQAFWQSVLENAPDSGDNSEAGTPRRQMAIDWLGQPHVIALAAQPEPMQDEDARLSDAFLRHLALREQVNAAAPPSRAIDLSWTYEQRAGETPEQHAQRLTSVQRSELSQSFFELAQYVYVPATDRLNLLKTFKRISGIPDLKALKRTHYELDNFPARPRGGALRSLSSLDIELRQITARINRLDDGQPKHSLLACVAACSAQVESALAFWEGILSNAVNEHLADENSTFHQQLANKWLGSGTDASIPEDDVWNIGDPLPDEDSFDEQIVALAPSHGLVPPPKSPASHLFTTPPASIPCRREVIVAEI